MISILRSWRVWVRQLNLAVLTAAGMVSGWAIADDAHLPIPSLTRHVVDTAGLLKQAQLDELDGRLWQFEKARGSQIAILIVPTTQPEPIEAYSIRAFDTWKLGRKQANDGILITVAVSDRKLRIDTGYGLEGAIPDAIAKRIVSEVIAPKFRGGDPYAGLVAGVEQIERLIEGEKLPAAKSAKSKQATAGDIDIGEMLVIGIVAATIIGGVLSVVLGRFLGGLATGGLVGFMAWLITSSTLVMIAAGVIVFFYVLVTGGRGGSSFGGFGGGGWNSGSGWGGGGGGWGGGGGGSAGGGGASGSW